MTNTLYFGDNLHVLRDHIADESVDLVYLDPPFNSNANYNILFKGPEGGQSESQIEAFEDTWHWNESAESAFDEVMRSGNTDAFTLLRAMRDFLGENDMMAYLAMMAVRLIELHRVLRPTGSLYLHCDPTASHYLKLLLDGVFGATNYRNEISWKRTSGHSSARRWGPSHDTIYFYSKSSDFVWNPVLQIHDEGHIAAKYKTADINGPFMAADLTGAGTRTGDSGKSWRGFDPTEIGRHWAVPKKIPKALVNTDEWESLTSQEKLDRLDTGGVVYWPKKEGGFPRFKRYLTLGVPIQSMITDIPPLNSQAQERLGYPTQKPLALLERIIAASSNEGDVVLDPFCGCGTAVHAAQKLGRRWIGIDVTHLAIGLIEKRMSEAFPGLEFEVKGRPQSLKSAEDLARRDKHQFELWALSVVDADPWKGGRKGADTGIDGIIWFKPDGKKTEKAIVEVKGGGVGPKDIGRLAQVIEREGAKIGVFLTAQNPTRAMERDAAAVGVWENEYTGRKHARLQIITLAELFQNKRPDIPWIDTSVARKAKREDTRKQGQLL